MCNTQHMQDGKAWPMCMRPSCEWRLRIRAARGAMCTDDGQCNTAMARRHAKQYHHATVQANYKTTNDSNKYPIVEWTLHAMFKLEHPKRDSER